MVYATDFRTVWSVGHAYENEHIVQQHNEGAYTPSTCNADVAIYSNCDTLIAVTISTLP